MQGLIEGPILDTNICGLFFLYMRGCLVYPKKSMYFFLHIGGLSEAPRKGPIDLSNSIF